MYKRLNKRLLVARWIWALALLFFSGPVYAQDGAPSDLEISAIAGSVSPFGENYALHITADGEGTFVRYLPGDPGAPPLEENSFTLTPAELNQVWQAIQDNDFFSLDSEHSRSDIIDRTFARLVVRADGEVHEVITRNVAVPSFDNITAVLNSVTPPGNNLVYDTSEPFFFTPRDVCEPNTTSSGIFSANDPLRPSGTKDKETAQSAASGRRSASAKVGTTGAHPGSVVAYRLSLQEAVNRGIATLEGKGGYYGDQVSITVDNAGSETSNTLDITLYLEFWGPEATAANVQRVEQAIESIWGGKTTSGGQSVNVNVETRLASGAASAPGTAGYHQIKLMNGSDSEVHGSNFEVNGGTLSGVWETEGPALDEVYAHEAGHLLGLEDRYEEYFEQGDGSWRRESDEKTFTVDELAAEIDSKYPDFTQEELKDWLEQPKNQRVTAPQDGHENDIMGANANKAGSVQQSDIDALAAQAGLIVEVRPGDIFVNENDAEQNFVVTRSVDLFILAGQSKTLQGLYVACIDAEDGAPFQGRGFDLAPRLDTWTNIEAAPMLMDLLALVDQREYFCNFNTQDAVWRITDNRSAGAGADAILQEAGLSLGDQQLDFPRMSNPNPDDPATTALIPTELLTVDVTPVSTIAGPGEAVTLTVGEVTGPSIEDFTVGFSWDLTPPDGSSATLSDPLESTTSFTTDVPGIYQVGLTLELTDAASETRQVERPHVARVVVPDDNTETFEHERLRGRYPWRTRGEAPWTLSGEDAHSGGSASASGQISHDESSTLEIPVSLSESGAITFAYRVSSEENFDVLTFSVDGVPQGGWSGDTGWRTATFVLGAGRRVLTWNYRKDGSVSSGRDRAWIDDVFFPGRAEVLPVELTSFEARMDDETVQLTWHTASETNNAGFDVHRKQRSAAEWATIGFVEGAGTSSEPQTYRFTDRELPFGAETFVYRLKQIDFDGAFAYSPEVVVERGAPDRLALQRPFPNPVRTHATIRYQLPQSAEVQLEVYDVTGRWVATLVTGRQKAGHREVVFDTRRLPSGLYFVRLAAGGTVRTQKITVVR